MGIALVGTRGSLEEEQCHSAEPMSRGEQTISIGPESPIYFRPWTERTAREVSRESSHRFKA